MKALNKPTFDLQRFADMQHQFAFDLQLFSEAIQGKKIVYLFRVLGEAGATGTMMAFATENGNTKSKDADSTATKDGSVRTPGVAETEITATSIMAKGDTLMDKLEAAMDADAVIEIWEVNLMEAGVEPNTGKFKCKYYQGYMTEIEKKANAEDMVEVSTTFGVNGIGKDGWATISAEQLQQADYVFKDTTVVAP